MLECCLTFRERNRPPFMNEFLGCHLLTHRPLTPQLSAIATGLRTSDVLLWLTIGRSTPHHTLTRFHYSVNRKGLGYEAELTCCERADVRSRRETSPFTRALTKLGSPHLRGPSSPSSRRYNVDPGKLP